MKSFINIPEIHTDKELKSFFKSHFDPTDLVLQYESDLSSDEYNSSFATRTDDGVLVIRSMKALNALDIEDFSIKSHEQKNIEEDVRNPLKGVLAIIGNENYRNRFGRIIPEDIKIMLNEAEMKDPKYFLSWAKYEGLCVISYHPEIDY